MSDMLNSVIRRLSSMDGAIEDMSINEIEDEVISAVNDLEAIERELNSLLEVVRDIEENANKLDALI